MQYAFLPYLNNALDELLGSPGVDSLLCIRCCQQFTLLTRLANFNKTSQKYFFDGTVNFFFKKIKKEKIKMTSCQKWLEF